jgi:hypothetical protein
MGGGERDDLPRVGRVRQHFVIPRHRGIEDDLPSFCGSSTVELVRSARRRPERNTIEDFSVLKHKKTVRHDPLSLFL